MKILYILDNPAGEPFFPALRLLVERGHRVHLAFVRIKTARSHERLLDLVDRNPGITFGRLPSSGRSDWAELARRLRLGIDYLRYLEPRYRHAAKLRARARADTTPALQRLGRAAALAGRPGLATLRGALRLAERCLVPPAQAERFLEEQSPDVAMVSPLVERGSDQADWLRAAKRLGIRTVYPVLSWDNLTNKGLVRDVPDLTIVWNEQQVCEAEELHGIPRERIAVTGASAYDHWFAWEPSRSREEFCREVGLRSDRPIVLYVGSSAFIAPDEPLFVERWIEALRAFGGIFEDVGFLVRPHPLESEEWLRNPLDGPQVAVWPPLGEEPLDDTARRNYFDSIHHATAVVGINTSAQIESAIVGRPVHTLLADEFRDTQEGTLHFQYLAAGSGHVRVARTLEEHASQLEESLRGRFDEARNSVFLQSFVRPRGLDVPATPLVVEAVERLAAAPAPRPDRGPAGARAVRLALRPLAAVARRTAAREKSREGTAGSAVDLRRLVYRLDSGEDDVPIVAGPWPGGEIGELLYWIPFLRWALTATVSLRGRLVVVGEAGSRCWYEGLDARYVPLDGLQGAGARKEVAAALAGGALDEALRPRLAEALGVGSGRFRILSSERVAAARPQLAEQLPAQRLRHRLLEYAPLPVPELPEELDLPDGFVAVHFGRGGQQTDTDAEGELAAAAIAALAGSGPLVALELPEHVAARLDERVVSRLRLLDLGRDRRAETAVIGRARGFLGSYGPHAYLASLLGTPAAGVHGDAARVSDDDVKTARSFLGSPPFGRLRLGHVTPQEIVCLLLEDADDSDAPVRHPAIRA